MALNSLEKSRYISSGGNHCPFCGSEEISGAGPIEADSNYAYQEIECLNEECQKRWHDHYVLVDVEEI